MIVFGEREDPQKTETEAEEVALFQRPSTGALCTESGGKPKFTSYSSLAYNNVWLRS